MIQAMAFSTGSRSGWCMMWPRAGAFLYEIGSRKQKGLAGPLSFEAALVFAASKPWHRFIT